MGRRVLRVGRATHPTMGLSFAPMPQSVFLLLIAYVLRPVQRVLAQFRRTAAIPL